MENKSPYASIAFQTNSTKRKKHYKKREEQKTTVKKIKKVLNKCGKHSNGNDAFMNFLCTK